ncbi:sulfotransferase [Thauera aminoaromatica]|jgi:hypothetical protein|uniref:Sulfotransferase n=1 Tax=Thauera aminoaromatica TaxID=164330 RepID=C4ZJK0_THASP|nr:sulfotransferase [Thauera aminoaromatica]ACK54382.1 conserved hypothetical protein [Thauera aminoaromatica]TXH78232.1 MAG: sulfotransferase [Thauera aminoaromatica]
MQAAKPPYRSPLVKAWNAIASAARRPVTLDARALLVAAQRKQPDAPPPPAATMDALGVLVEAIHSGRSALHPFGRYYLEQMFAGLLSNRMRLAKFWAEHPETLADEVRQPVIVVGLPRCGTSYLFNLLAHDPEHRYLTNWETTVSQIPPTPPPVTLRQDPRRRIGKLLMAFQRHLAPGLESIHEFHLDGPEECTPLLMQGFDTQALAGMFDAPDYSHWLDHADHRATYQHHRRILLTLQRCYPAGRWLLKSPDHLAALEALLETYPDACLIQLHRDPVQAVSSWASLNAAFRGIWSERIDAAELGPQILERLATDMDASIDARQRLPADRFLDLQYRDLIADPLGQVERIHAHFGLDFAPSTRARVESFLHGDRDKKRSHAYAPEHFGLSAERIRERFARYIGHYGVAPAR